MANGLAFSVDTPKVPASLGIVFKALAANYPNLPVRRKACLDDWVDSGVMLLNSALTVDRIKSGSHIKLWSNFTRKLLEYLDSACRNLVFICWGNAAMTQVKHLSGDHLILTASHPQKHPFPYDLIEANHFSKTNDFLISRGVQPISWYAPNHFAQSMYSFEA